MSKGYKAFLPVLVLLLVGVIGCAEKVATEEKPQGQGQVATEEKPQGQGQVATEEKPQGQGQVDIESNESIITGNLVAARVSSGDYPWEFDIRVSDVGDILGRENLIKAEAGQVLTAKTKQYLLGFTIGQGITCNIRVEKGEQGTFYVAWDVR